MHEVNPQARILVTDKVDLRQIWRDFNMLNVYSYTSDQFCTFYPFTDITECKEKIEDFEDDKLKDFMGAVVNITMFEETAISKRQGDRYTYQDGEAVYLLSQALNFTANYLTNPDGQSYGIKLSKIVFQQKFLFHLQTSR